MAKSKYPKKPQRPLKSDPKSKWTDYEKELKTWETACCQINRDEADKLKIVEKTAEQAKKKPSECTRAVSTSKRKRR